MADAIPGIPSAEALFGGMVTHRDLNAPKDETDTVHRVRTRNTKTVKKLSRKVTSEHALEETLDWHLRPGDCWHCFSFGDVDSLTYFRHVLREQRIERAIISTWCMAAADIHEIDAWQERGLLGRVDFYIGEIFSGTYSGEYALLLDLVKRHGGRVAVFRNHSKVMVLIGERYSAVIESSANVNTNPRSEQTVITVDDDLADFYIEIFNGINPFNTNDQPGRWLPCEQTRSG